MSGDATVTLHPSAAARLRRLLAARLQLHDALQHAVGRVEVACGPASPQPRPLQDADGDDAGQELHVMAVQAGLSHAQRPLPAHLQVFLELPDDPAPPQA